MRARLHGHISQDTTRFAALGFLISYCCQNTFRHTASVRFLGRSFYAAPFAAREVPEASSAVTPSARSPISPHHMHTCGPYSVKRHAHVTPFPRARAAHVAAAAGDAGMLGSRRRRHQPATRTCRPDYALITARPHTVTRVLSCTHVYSCAGVRPARMDRAGERRRSRPGGRQVAGQAGGR